MGISHMLETAWAKVLDWVIVVGFLVESTGLLLLCV